MKRIRPRIAERHAPRYDEVITMWRIEHPVDNKGPWCGEVWGSWRKLDVPCQPYPNEMPEPVGESWATSHYDRLRWLKNNHETLHAYPTLERLRHWWRPLYRKALRNDGFRVYRYQILRKHALVLRDQIVFIGSEAERLESYDPFTLRRTHEVEADEGQNGRARFINRALAAIQEEIESYNASFFTGGTAPSSSVSRAASRGLASLVEDA